MISVGLGLPLPVVVVAEITGELGSIPTTTMMAMMRTPTTFSAAAVQAEERGDSGELVALAGAAVEADQVVRAVAVEGRRTWAVIAPTVETKVMATMLVG